VKYIVSGTSNVPRRAQSAAHSNDSSPQHLGGGPPGSRSQGISPKLVVPVVPHPSKQGRKHRMMQLAKNLWNDESGQGLAEYALLLGLIVIGVVVLIQGMGVSIKNIFNRANSDLTQAATPQS
jgi:pilus assembly protein Flp/PilA